MAEQPDVPIRQRRQKGEDDQPRQAELPQRARRWSQIQLRHRHASSIQLKLCYVLVNLVLLGVRLLLLVQDEVP